MTLTADDVARPTRVDIAKLFDATTGGVIAGAFEAMAWADDEIAAALERHPAELADVLWHAFGVLAGSPGMTEPVYRSHARELLERVAAGADTRPPTWAELVQIASDSSQMAPMTGAGTGLYLRAFAQAFPDQALAAEVAAELPYYERLHGPEMVELERDMRRRFAQPDRVLAVDPCDGRHRLAGRELVIACRFVPPPADPSLFEEDTA